MLLNYNISTIQNKPTKEAIDKLKLHLEKEYLIIKNEFIKRHIFNILDKINFNDGNIMEFKGDTEYRIKDNRISLSIQKENENDYSIFIEDLISNSAFSEIIKYIDDDTFRVTEFEYFHENIFHVCYKEAVKDKKENVRFISYGEEGVNIFEKYKDKLVDKKLQFDCVMSSIINIFAKLKFAKSILLGLGEYIDLDSYVMFFETVDSRTYEMRTLIPEDAETRKTDVSKFIHESLEEYKSVLDDNFYDFVKNEFKRLNLNFEAVEILWDSYIQGYIGRDSWAPDIGLLDLKAYYKREKGEIITLGMSNAVGTFGFHFESNEKNNDMALKDLFYQDSILSVSFDVYTLDNTDKIYQTGVSVQMNGIHRNPSSNVFEFKDEINDEMLNAYYAIYSELSFEEGLRKIISWYDRYSHITGVNSNTFIPFYRLDSTKNGKENKKHGEFILDRPSEIKTSIYWG